MNEWLNRALAAASEAVTEPVVQDADRVDSADSFVRADSADSADSSFTDDPACADSAVSADRPLTALTTLSASIEPLRKQADRTSPDRTTAPVAAQEWTAAAAHLQQLDCPATVSEERWQQVRADADRLLDWAQMLEAMDWTVEDTFGRDDLDRQSLAWKVNGQRIGPIGKVAAILRGDDDSTTWVYPRGDK